MTYHISPSIYLLLLRFAIILRLHITHISRSMPKYVVFFITANRPEASDAKDNNEISNEPVFQEIMQGFLSWIQAEIKSERIKDGAFLLDASEETNIRVDFHSPETVPEIIQEGEPANSTLTRGHQNDMSTNILGYYTAEFPTVKDVIAWARSCPISYDGFAVEIRQLRDTGEAISEATSEVREWAGDQIVFMRKRLFEQGKMKRDDDGTLWIKLEDEKEIKEIVEEAEKRDARTDVGGEDR
jgi:hypothetical protein